MPGYYDRRVGAQTKITEQHEQIHRGKSFTVSIVDTIMGDADALIVAFATGDQTVHLTYQLSVAMGGDIEICENPVWTEGSGTLTQIINKNRAYQIPSSVKSDLNGTQGFVLKNPTGYQCDDQKFGSIRLGFLWFFKPTDLSRLNHDYEFILKKNTRYGIKYTAAIVNDPWWASDAAQIIMDWYEVKGTWYNEKVKDFNY